MPRPTRKHPGFNSLVDSEAGREFCRRIEEFLGAPLDWTPLERTRDNRHIFLLIGAARRGLLVEAQEVQGTEEGSFVHETGFLYQPDAAGFWLGTCTAHRWDPWLAAQQSGNRILVEGPRARLYKARDEKNAEMGARLDQTQFDLVPPDKLPSTLCDVPCDHLLRLHAEFAGGPDQSDGVATTTWWFKCGACDAIAATVTFLPPGMPDPRPFGDDAPPDLDRFFIDSARLSIDRGPRPVTTALMESEAAVAAAFRSTPSAQALYSIDPELAPFWCPRCRRSYCKAHWKTETLFDDGFYECTKGKCPRGHERTLDD